MTLKVDGTDIVYADHINNLDPLTLASAVYPTGFTGTRLQNAINSLPSTGGLVFLRPGTYSCGTVISITKADVHILGSGLSTILSGPASTYTISITKNRAIIEKIRFNMHGTGGGGIAVDGPADGSGVKCHTFRDLFFHGGASSAWSMRVTNTYDSLFENIYCGNPETLTGNGVLFDNTDVFNCGDSTINNLIIFLGANGTTGIRVHGVEAAAGAFVNGLAFQNAVVSTLVGGPTGMTGIQIVNCSWNSFHLPHVENVNRGIEINGGVGGGAHSRNNAFFGGLISSPVVMYANTRRNFFIGPEITTSSYVDANSGTPNVMYAVDSSGIMKLQTTYLSMKNRGEQVITIDCIIKGGLSVGTLVMQSMVMT